MTEQNHTGGDRFRSNRIRRHRQAVRRRILTVVGVVAAVIALGLGMYFGIRGISRWVHSIMDDPVDPTAVTGSQSDETEESTEALEERYREQLETARLMALQYDYEGAAGVIRSISGYDKVPLLTNLVTEYLTAQGTLVKADITKAYHLFFNPLIVDTELAFRAKEANEYNKSMTTVAEFREILEELYERGFVLVSMHDLAYTDAGGSFVKGTIMLPEGKKPLVLSLDDVNYYEYMEGDGFASRLILDEQGRPLSEMVLQDGTVETGLFDAVPILDAFIEEHPDFSYRGAKGLICLTGYEGIFGYRTAPKYGNPEDPDYKKTYASIDWEAEKQQAAEVAAGLKARGWEFASHSWGHINMSKADDDWIRRDTEKWLEQVGTLLGGGTDILAFAYGADIGNWRNYTLDNTKFKYLQSKGFKYFCNVDTTTIPWVQFSSSAGYLRQGRVNLDGSEMYNYADRIKLFIDPEKVFDSSRPLPVPKY